jgi:glutathione synthase/RimK-type ligase-like ATP-grasp enzyme
MTRILIATNPGDPDSFLVQEALERKGHHVKLAHTSDFPQKMQKTISYVNSVEHWTLSSLGIEYRNEVPDVVWWRRPAKPVLPSWVHSNDWKFAALECESFQESFWEAFSRMGSFWINNPRNSKMADDKIRQQKLAIDCGLETPSSLYGNDPKEIRSFLRKMGGKAIYKPLKPFYASWTEKGKKMCLYTSIIEEGVLPADEVLALTPGIFQELLPKEFELRVVIMGRKVFAFRIDVPEGSRGRLDWRSAYHEIAIQKTSLPLQVEESLLALVQQLGIVSGSCDLIVTPEGRTVFLEINEAGQFLWLERYVEFPLLDAFCEFLIQHREDFIWEEAADSLRVSHVHESARTRLRTALTEHILQSQPQPGSKSRRS